MDSLRRPFTRSRIELIAQRFRDEHAPGVLGHLEFDEIIEFQLHMEIVPRVGVKARSGKVGWLAVDGRTIVVDEAFQRDHPKEYQSFLAHEVSHARMHWMHLPRKPLTRAEFGAFHSGLDPILVQRLEHEARTMGLHLQMPQREFGLLFDDLIEFTQDRFPALDEAAEKYVQREIAEHFGVSPARARIRMDWEWRRMQKLLGRNDDSLIVAATTPLILDRGEVRMK